MSNKFKGILILSDFDGTFAGIDSRLVDRNLEAIEYFKSEGGFFTLSTGRLPSMLKKVFPTFRDILNYPLIQANGAILFDPVKNEIISERFYDGVQARIDFKDIIEKFHVEIFSCYSDDGNIQHNTTPDDVIGNKWRKSNFTLSSDEEAIRARDYVRSTYSDRYNCFRSAPAFFEIVGKDCTKGKRMDELKAMSDIPLKTFCIGDYENDIEMLRAADAAFCPSNAIDDVKSICDHVVCHHDKGAIADMISIIEEKYL